MSTVSKCTQRDGSNRLFLCPASILDSLVVPHKVCAELGSWLDDWRNLLIYHKATLAVTHNGVELDEIRRARTDKLLARSISSPSISSSVALSTFRLFLDHLCKIPNDFKDPHLLSIPQVLRLMGHLALEHIRPDDETPQRRVVEIPKRRHIVLEIQEQSWRVVTMVH